MRTRPLLALLAAASLVACAGGRSAPETTSAPRPLVYPPAHRGDVVDVYHGTPVADPYRWLEDPDDAATQAWIAAENELTFGYLDTIPQRDAIRARLLELMDYERFTTPIVRGSRVFYERNDGLQDQSILYVADSAEAEPRVLLDPATFSDDGTVALANVVPSRDGKLLAYGLSDGGSDWRVWHVRDVETGADLPGVVTRNKFGRIQWAHDGSGFYYMRYDVPPEGTELEAFNPPPDICFHRIGTDEGEDQLVHARPTAEGVNHYFSLADDGRTLMIGDWDSTSRHTELRLLDAWHPDLPERDVVTGFDAQHRALHHRGDAVLLRTDLDAPNWRVVAVNPNHPEREHWVDVVPESRQAINAVRVTGGRIFVHYLSHATSVERVFDLHGRPLGEVELPGKGTARGFGGLSDATETYYSYTSFDRPETIYRLDIATGESTLFRAPAVKFDPDDYVTRQVFYPSKDGTRVPMFITHRRDVVPNGDTPTYLYGYGGFNISMLPRFSTTMIVWMELGGVYAVANLRGGGEYGEEWHAAGTKLQKQNVFDDFIAAAEWLIEDGVTRPERLAIGGGSNGGLLVGACMIQRPDLFGACLPAVGVMDMLRYHRFTIGWGWAGDYGTSDDPDEFAALHAYSPYHNLRRGTAYPATMVTTAERDDRVVPAHSFKFAAALQHAHAGDDPVLIRIQTRAGHGAGKSTTQRIDEAADRWAFLVRELGMRGELAVR
jgi:prolyl oligopeptidase